MSFQADSAADDSVKDIDLTIKNLLQNILIELKIANMYNQLTHDEKIKEEDVDED